MQVPFSFEIEGFAVVSVERLTRLILDVRNGLTLAITAVVDFVSIASDPNVMVSVLLSLDGHVCSVSEPAQGHVIGWSLVGASADHMSFMLVRTCNLHVIDFALRIHVEALHDRIADELHALAVDNLVGQGGP